MQFAASARAIGERSDLQGNKALREFTTRWRVYDNLPLIIRMNYTFTPIIACMESTLQAPILLSTLDPTPLSHVLRLSLMFGRDHWRVSDGCNTSSARRDSSAKRIITEHRGTKFIYELPESVR